MAQHDTTRYDAVIVGGGPAGLSAALVLGRARRRVLVVDDGGYRNRPAYRSHGYFTRDGAPPDEILRLGRTELEAFDVTIRASRVESAIGADAGFLLHLEDASRVTARKLVLAPGVEDVLPDIPGFRELWGKSVFHCPYCHGWEVRGAPLALYGSGTTGYELAALLLGWSIDLILFTDGPDGLDEDDRRRIERKGVRICEEPVARLAGDGAQLEAVELASGERVPRTALFLKPQQRPHNGLALALGCEVADDGRIEASRTGRTCVEGVYVAGDLGPNVQQVLSAAASGAEAGMQVNEELLKEDFLA